MEELDFNAFRQNGTLELKKIK